MSKPVAQEMAGLKAGLGREVMTVGLSGDRKIKVVKNPTPDDYWAFGEMFREKYPDAPKGSVKTRTTRDAYGNVYAWSSDYMHAPVEGALDAQYGIKAN